MHSGVRVEFCFLLPLLRHLFGDPLSPKPSLWGCSFTASHQMPLGLRAGLLPAEVTGSKAAPTRQKTGALEGSPPLSEVTLRLRSLEAALCWR